MRPFASALVLFQLVVAAAACQKMDQGTSGAGTSSVGTGPESYLEGRGPECYISGASLDRFIKSVLGPEADKLTVPPEAKLWLMGTPSDGLECSTNTIDYMIRFLGAPALQSKAASDVAVELPNIPAGSAGSRVMLRGFAVDAQGRRSFFSFPVGNSTPAQIERFKNCVTGMAMARGCFVYFGDL